MLYIHGENILTFEFQPYQELSQFVMTRKVGKLFDRDNGKDFT